MNYSGLRLSEHAKRQQRRRGLSESDICLVLEHGIEVPQVGRTAFFLTTAAALHVNTPQAARLVGMAVIVSDEGTVITTFRSRTTKGLRKWREFNPRKPQ